MKSRDSQTKRVIRKPRAVAGLESKLLRVVRGKGSISRVDLAREMELVPSTAGIYVERLLRDRYLVEMTPAARTLGRPPILLELNPDAGRFIGVDFDARQIMAVAVDFAQQPLVQVRRTIPVHSGAERVLSLIEEVIQEAAGSQRRNVLGIGLGVPGPIDADRGLSLRYDFIRDWQNVPIGPRMAAKFRVPVFVENNLRSMALGELWCGCGQGLRHLVCLGIRSGIGAGIIVDGKLLGGAHNLAGEIGRWSYPGTGGLESGSGRTIEDVASVTALLSAAAEKWNRRRNRGLGQSPSVDDLLTAVAEGDRPYVELIEQAARVHGWIAHQLTLLLDPERIVLAGPLVESAPYLAALRQTVDSLGGGDVVQKIVCSSLGPFAGAIGAAALAIHHWVPGRNA
jgi:predicted NBD/HSP70 family sugar kinase